MIIDGKNTPLGRLASYAAKQVLKGENIIVVNCAEVIITGNRKNIEENFKIKRSRVGSSQKGPKHSELADRIVKRTIRGMLPTHRFGRGRIAFKKIRCYVNVPKEFEEAEKINLIKNKKIKFVRVKQVAKK